MMNINKEKIIKQIINVFETGKKNTVYDTIYTWNDGKNNRVQYTLSRGYTEDGGNLKKVVDLYIRKNGKYSNQLKEFSPRIGKGVLYKNPEFENLLIKSSREDQKMRDAQDEIFDKAYYIPALNWFKSNGFKSPLSLLVIFDSFVHSGSILQFLRNKFRESTPSNGGREEVWIKEYIKARRGWLASHSNPILRKTVYRCDFFNSQIDRGNWNLNCGLVANGVKIC